MLPVIREICLVPDYVGEHLVYRLQTHGISQYA